MADITSAGHLPDLHENCKHCQSLGALCSCTAQTAPPAHASTHTTSTCAQEKRFGCFLITQKGTKLLVPWDEDEARGLGLEWTDMPVGTLTPHRKNAGTWIKGLKPVREGFQLPPDGLLSRKEFYDALEEKSPERFTVCWTCVKFRHQFPDEPYSGNVAYKHGVQSGLDPKTLESHEKGEKAKKGHIKAIRFENRDMGLPFFNYEGMFLHCFRAIRTRQTFCSLAWRHGGHGGVLQHACAFAQQLAPRAAWTGIHGLTFSTRALKSMFVARASFPAGATVAWQWARKRRRWAERKQHGETKQRRKELLRSYGGR